MVWGEALSCRLVTLLFLATVADYIHPTVLINPEAVVLVLLREGRPGFPDWVNGLSLYEQ